MEESEKDKVTETPVAVWSEPEKETEKKDAKEDVIENPFKTNYDVIVNFSECTTIQCIAYMFFYYQTNFGKIFWLVVMILMGILGLYWIITAYIDWKNNPVLTTITTTAYPVKQIEFPAVTFCSQGMDYHLFNAGFWKLFLDFLQRNNKQINITPYEAATLMANTDESELSPSDLVKLNLLNEKVNNTLFNVFINESFPGANDNGIEMIYLLMLLNSRNPDIDLATEVALNGGFNPCKSGSSSTQQAKSSDTPPCPDEFVSDNANKLCYSVLPDVNDIYDSKSICESLDGELITFDSNDQVKGLIALFEAGTLKLPDASNGFFFLDGGLGNGTLNNVILNQEDGSQYCLAAKYTPKLGKLNVYQADCNANNVSLCRKVQFVTPNCSEPYKPDNLMDIFFDPALQQKRKQGVAQMKKFNVDLFQRLQQTKAFQAMFSVLWRASLPCSDLRDLTSQFEGEKSIIRYCEWKGEPISCAAIFKAFPTDNGICCSFNIKAAEEIFNGNTYPRIITQLQNQDKSFSFLNPSVPNAYSAKGEPKASPGQSKGLLLLLDAHTDLLTTVSVDSDVKGFKGVISPKGSFPYVGLEGFDIKPGHNNLIALTGTQVTADKNLRGLDKTARKCLFPDETDMIKIHKNYSYSNCMFECNILNAQEYLQKSKGLKYSCMPWFFPNPDEQVQICDPWETKEFFKIMTYNIPDEACFHCLPDCTTTIYETSIATTPFKECTLFNFGVSPQCNPDNAGMPEPRKFAAKVLEEFQDKSPQPKYLSGIKSNIRQYSTDTGIFTKDAKKYDAYEEDIAMVQIYFKKSSLIQMGSQPRMSWIDYFATVGGLLGLVLGMGIVSIIELFWLCLRFGARKLNLTDWVR